jgi:predicted house-cleaning noncanonical NTP pyrophosphatase (MazG superfamily)
MIKTYNKLVRDKIPEIIKNAGKECNTKILDDKDYLKFLDEKLSEECKEYQESKEIEEIADVLEVLHSIVKVRGYSWAEVENIRKEKVRKRGSFNDKIFLEDVIE